MQAIYDQEESDGPGLVIPEGKSWEDIAGQNLPAPKSGSAQQLGDCPQNRQVKVEGLSGESYDKFKQDVDSATWAEIEHQEPFDAEKKDITVFQKENDTLNLDYDLATGTLFLTRTSPPAAPDKLILPGKQWGDIMPETVPPLPQGMITTFQDVRGAMQRAAFTQVSAESYEKWLEDIENEGWIQQPDSFQAIFEKALERRCGPTIKTARGANTFTGVPVEKYFLRADVMLEIVYDMQLLAITHLIP